MKQKNTGSRYLIFFLVTLFYLVTKWITFKGFSGTDDLHYANLASNVLKGSYSPFVLEDIFSGRIGLIYLQASIYFIGGINAFTTQIATLLVTVLCCYLTVFRLGQIKKTGGFLAACSLFYFNPVLSQASLGIMPDVYIMLTVIVVIMLWRKNFHQHSKTQFVGINILIGFIILAAMFFKENAIICIPFIFCLGIHNRKQQGINAMVLVMTTFAVGVFICGGIYYHYTSDFFFRVHQIQHSNYPNVCNYALLPAKDLIIRLTYGVWKEFIITGFLPVILATILISTHFLRKKNFRKQMPINVIYFIILTVLGLYFPFSLKGYQPLCYNSRHFIFLYPFGVIIVIEYLQVALEKNGVRYLKYFFLTSLFLLTVAMLGSGNKWMWMIYGLLSACFMCYLFIKNGIIFKLRYFCFAIVVWLYMPYNLFFGNSNWFKHTDFLAAQLSEKYYYFPEHVNMMTWKLFHRFNSSFHTYNLEPTPFKLFAPYYEKMDTMFHPGWLIVNTAFTERSTAYLLIIRELGSKGYFKAQKKVGDMYAFYINDTIQFKYISALTAVDFANYNNCCK